jgi:hypothetical protein
MIVRPAITITIESNRAPSEDGTVSSPVRVEVMTER